MPERRHEREAEKLLVEIVSGLGADSQILLHRRHLLAEALEKAEQRGRERSGREKESSG